MALSRSSFSGWDSFGKENYHWTAVSPLEITDIFNLLLLPLLADFPDSPKNAENASNYSEQEFVCEILSYGLS